MTRNKEVTVASPAVPPVPPASPDTPAPAGFLSTLVGVYTAPGETFRAMTARPSFVAPLVALVLLNIVFSFVWTRRMDPVEFSKTQMEESGVLDKIPPERQAEILERQAKMVPIFAFVGPIVIAPIGFVVLSAIFLFVFRFFFGAEITFRHSLAVVCWSLFAVALVTTPLTLLILFLKGDWNVNPGEVVQANGAALLDRATAAKPLYALASTIDAFSFWTMYLISAGFAAMSKKTVGSAAAGVVTLWAIYVLGKVAIAAVF